MIISIVGSPTDYNQFNSQLAALSEQLDRIELHLNNSISQLLTKMDESHHDIAHLIKQAHPFPVDHDDHSSPSRPVSALLVIDVQYDFINGTLALRDCPSKHNGEEVIPVINQLLDKVNFDVVVYSQDWHPTDHISFFDNLHLRSKFLTKDSVPLDDLKMYSTATFALEDLPPTKQTLWPRHCVQNTFGAQFHSDLKVLEEDSKENTSVIVIQKGTKPHIDSYSAFWDNAKLSETKLNQQLKDKHVTQVFVTGLATDWCVYFTAMDAIENGYKTFIIEDAARGVDENTIKERLEDFRQKKGHVIQSNQVKDYFP
ncbi:unnamed protein product [Adineta ricciae]|uniref:nicotinamidase n=1 Tax=Adineta ricciae TaxID=249248 RepID=A0A813Q2Z2_ADIRI|nr:unnamed protein product [Adineta ricciae]CAF0919036.1 unnamed protein product [Adineta ricciae]